MDVPCVSGVGAGFFTPALPFDEEAFAPILEAGFFDLTFMDFCLEVRILLGFGKRIVVELDCSLGAEVATVVCPSLIVNRSLKPDVAAFAFARELVALHKRGSFRIQTYP